MSTTVTYLRQGRKLRASGKIVDNASKTGLVKVKPSRDDWGHVWLTPAEVAAGKGKPIVQARKAAPSTTPRKLRAPKPQPLPMWKHLVAEVRSLEIEHVPEGWPCVRMKTMTYLANELESAHAKLAEFLPVVNAKCIRATD